MNCDSLNKQSKHIHNFELDSNNNKVLSRSEYFYHNNHNINSFINDSNFKYVLNNITDKSYNIYKEKLIINILIQVLIVHQDILAYPDSQDHITCLIPLCNTYKLNGSIQFSPLINNNLDNNTILESTNSGVIKNQDKLIWNPPVLTNFGDIILFNSYIPHKSSSNISEQPRKSLYLTFNKLEEGYIRDDYYEKKNKAFSIIDHYTGDINYNNNNNLHIKTYN